MTEKIKEEIIEVEDLHSFVSLLNSWHKEKVAILEYLIEIPVGTEMEYEGKTITLIDDTLLAFKAGINLALGEIGILPFQAVTEGVTNASPAN